MEYHVKQTGNLPAHTLIVGGQGVGKSTLIRRVLEALDVEVSGYITRKEPQLADPELGDPIYIYEAGGAQKQSADNLAGHCRDQRPLVNPEAFDRFAEKLQHLSVSTEFSPESEEAARNMTSAVETQTKTPSLILMDEVGVMERHSESFCQAVLDLLDGEKPILAAVKYKDRPYLNQVRSHPRCRCFTITEENRNELYEEVLAFVREQIECSQHRKTECL